MAGLDQLFDEEPTVAATSAAALGLARAKLKPPVHPVSVWPLLAAAGLAACAALSLAAVVILGAPAPAEPRLQADVNPWMR